MKLITLPRNEETVAIDNMMAEVGELDLEILSNSGISRWPVLINQENARYKEAAREFLDNTVQSAETTAASMLAPELHEAVEGLISMLYANILISKSESLKQAYATIDELVETYR